MKKILLSIVALMATFTASAQFSTDPAVLKIANGEEKTVTFSLKTEEPVTLYEFWMILPEGLEVVYDAEEEEYLIELLSNNAKSHSLTADYKKGSTTDFFISVSSSKLATLKALEGDVLSITFKATADVTSPIKIQGPFAGTPSEKKISFDDFEINVNSEDAINGISADETKSGVIYNMAGQRVSKATKGIYVIDGKKVAVSK